IRYGMKDIERTNYEKYFDEYFDMIYCINLQNKDDNYNSMIIKLTLAGIKKCTFFRFKASHEIDNLVEVFNFVKSNKLMTDTEKHENTKIIKTSGEIGCVE